MQSCNNPRWNLRVYGQTARLSDSSGCLLHTNHSASFFERSHFSLFFSLFNPVFNSPLINSLITEAIDARSLIFVPNVSVGIHHGLKLKSCISAEFKDVRAHCYCASLVRTLFIRHARATSFSSACTKSKTQQNIELMTFALTWCANIFVGCSVTPNFFSADHFLL